MYLVDLCEYWNIGIDTYFMMICKELAKLYKFLFFIKTNCGHLGFLPVISVFQNIWLGTVAVFDPYTFSLLCANFHAFKTKPTIPLKYDSNLLHYKYWWSYEQKWSFWRPFWIFPYFPYFQILIICLFYSLIAF